MENRLYVGNLPDDVSADALRKRFAEFGEVSDVHLAIDRGSGRMRGHAFVTMASPAEAQVAITRLNGAVFEDRRLRVSVAGEDRDRERSRSKAADPAKITSQFRERANMAYELDCAGVTIAIKMFPEDPTEKMWRIEATVKGARVIEPKGTNGSKTATITNGEDGVMLSSSAPTRAAALQDLALICKENESNGLSSLDWGAITDALTNVRAI